MSHLSKLAATASFSVVCASASAAEPCTNTQRPELRPGDSFFRYTPKSNPMPNIEIVIGSDCKHRIYRLNNSTGVFELDPAMAKSAPADTPKTFSPPTAVKPSPESDLWFNRKAYLPEATPRVSIIYKPTSQSLALRDPSLGECHFANGVVVRARGSVMLDTRTVYALSAKPENGTCILSPSLKVHVIDTPTKISQSGSGFYNAAYGFHSQLPAPRFYKTAAPLLIIAGAYATSLMLVYGMYYLNPLLAQDVADPARNLAKPSTGMVALSPAVTAGIDAQRRALGLDIDSSVDIFLTPNGSLLGPLKLFNLMGIVPNSQAKPTAEFCAAAKRECIALCTDELDQPGIDGRVNQGNPFFKCLERCLADVGCAP